MSSDITKTRIVPCTSKIVKAVMNKTYIKPAITAERIEPELLLCQSGETRMNYSFDEKAVHSGDEEVLSKESSIWDHEW